MVKDKSNITRIFNQLLDTYWLENECLKVRSSGSPYRCADVIYTREAARCRVCMGYLLVKEAMRCALGEERDEERRNTDQTTTRLQ